MKASYQCVGGCGAMIPTRAARCYACRWAKDPAIKARLDLPWHADVASQEFVDLHPGGATLEEVAVELGLVRERIRQIEERALAKLASAARRPGFNAMSLLAEASR